MFGFINRNGGHDDMKISYIVNFYYSLEQVGGVEQRMINVSILRVKTPGTEE